MRFTRREKGFMGFASAVCLGSLCVGDAIDTAYQQMALYGIDRETGVLARYDFTTGIAEDIGIIRNSSGTALTGIEASAYIPGFTNIFGFWTDPSDGESKLLYINCSSGAASVVGSSLGTDQVTGAVAVGGQVYAIQQPPETSLGFTIDGGRVIPDSEFAVKVSVLGADISYGGLYEEPVTVKVRIGNSYFEPFGTYTAAVDGNTHDHTVHHAVISGTFDAEENISIIGRNWIKKKSYYSGSSNNHWKIRNTVTSTDDVPEVIVLMNGDDVPDIDPFLDQSDIVDFIADYVDFDTNTVVLEDNQAIYLFELGSGGATSSSADFQDLVVLITLGASEEELSGGTGTSGSMSGRININPNNSSDHEFTLTMPDGSMFTRDDLHSDTDVDGDGVFYEGPADEIRVKPMGSKDENSLTIDGVAYDLENSTLYTIVAGAGGMNVRVYNDHINGSGKAMGHWNIEFIGGDGTVYGDDPPSGGGSGDGGRLITVDHKTGAVTELMTLTNSYDSLASEDGIVFYATGGGGMYRIDTTDASESLIGAVAGDEVTALEFVGLTIMGFDVVNDHLVPLSTVTAAALGSPASLGLYDLGTMIFMNAADDPAADSHAFD